MTQTDDRQAESTRRAVVDVVVPVYNEAAELESSVRRLRAYLDGSFPFEAVVTIADNASTDTTWAIATRLAANVPGVRAVHLDVKGADHASFDCRQRVVLRHRAARAG